MNILNLNMCAALGWINFQEFLSNANVNYLLWKYARQYAELDAKRIISLIDKMLLIRPLDYEMFANVLEMKRPTKIKVVVYRLALKRERRGRYVVLYFARKDAFESLILCETLILRAKWRERAVFFSWMTYWASFVCCGCVQLVLIHPVRAPTPFFATPWYISNSWPLQPRSSLSSCATFSLHYSLLFLIPS